MIPTEPGRAMGSWQRVVMVLLIVMMSLGSPAGAATARVPVVELLRVQVPAEQRQAWLEAELGSWEPWLAQKEGFLSRELFWDPKHQEATLLIRWASRDQWHSIPASEVQAVQKHFEALARQATGQPKGNPFPLVFAGELQPQ